MASQAKGEDAAQQALDSQQAASSSTGGWGRRMVVEQYLRIKENAETYPYVWGSYVLVYGGFGLWMTYRWRRLRNTEDRVRVLQERLRKLVEEESSAGMAVADKAPKDSLKPKE